MARELKAPGYEQVQPRDVIIGGTEGYRYETVIIGTETPEVKCLAPLNKKVNLPVMGISPGILRFTKFIDKHPEYGDCHGFFWPFNRIYWEKYFDQGREKSENKIIEYVRREDDLGIGKELLTIAQKQIQAGNFNAIGNLREVIKFKEVAKDIKRLLKT